jgi:hypothetical protein
VSFPTAELGAAIGSTKNNPFNENLDTAISLAIPPQDPCSQYAWVAELLQIDYQFDYSFVVPPATAGLSSLAIVADPGGVTFRAVVRTSPTISTTNMYSQANQKQFQLGDPHVLHAWEFVNRGSTAEAIVYDQSSSNSQNGEGSQDLTDENGNGVLVPGPNLYFALYAAVDGNNWFIPSVGSTNSSVAHTKLWNWKVYFRYRKVALQEYLQMVQWQGAGF